MYSGPYLVRLAKKGEQGGEVILPFARVRQDGRGELYFFRELE